MRITITSRHYELTPALKDYAEKKVKNLKKYFDHIVNAHITFSLEKYRQAVEVTVHVNGKNFNSKEESEDMYSSVDGAVDKLERQILKHKGKMKKFKPNRKISDLEYSFHEPAEEENSGTSAGEEIVVMDSAEFPSATLKEAVDKMRGNGQDYSIFSNTETNRLNLIFVRDDGRIGLVEL